MMKSCQVGDTMLEYSQMFQGQKATEQLKEIEIGLARRRDKDGWQRRRRDDEAEKSVEPISETADKYMHLSNH